MRLERPLLGALFLMLGAFYAWLLFSQRLPRGHDTLSLSYVLQYLFLAQGGELPLWLPYSTHGIVSSWYVGMGGGLLTSSLTLVGVPEGTNAHTLFHFGLLLEEMLLLVGTWRLGGFFFRSPWTRFFVTASVVGSSFWAEQIWHNHRALVAIPLALSFLIGFLEKGRRRDLFLGINLLALQFIGNIPYTAVLTILVTVTYAVVYAIVFRRPIRPRWADVPVLLLNAGILLAIYYTLTSGTGDAALHQEGREAGGQVTLAHFLSHGGALDPVRFVDMMLGVSPFRDFTLYVGAAALPLALLGIARRPGRKALYFTVCLVLVLLLSLGYLSIVAMIAYGAAPPLRFYRYLATAAVHVRIPLLLLAGLGVESLLRGAADGRRKTAIALGLLGVACLAFSANGGDLWSFLQTPAPMLAASQGSENTLTGLLIGSGLASLAAAAALASRASGVALAAALVAVQTVDLARWRVQLTRHRTVQLSAEQYAAQKLRPLPYIERRSLQPTGSLNFGDGGVYDVTENFIPRDPPASTGTAPFWMSSTDQLLRAYGGRGPAVWRGTVRPPYDKVIGLSADKLQVFRAAHATGKTAELLNDRSFRGDVLLIEGAGSTPKLDADERLAARPEVVAFGPNLLAAKVTVPERAWLLYCDAWHSSWRATVNGKPVPIERAFLAYKAVPLEAGANHVEFRFEAPRRVWTCKLAALNALLWVAGVFALAFSLLVSPASREASSPASGPPPPAWGP